MERSTHLPFQDFHSVAVKSSTTILFLKAKTCTCKSLLSKLTKASSEAWAKEVHLIIYGDWCQCIPHPLINPLHHHLRKKGAERLEERGRTAQRVAALIIGKGDRWLVKLIIWKHLYIGYIVLKKSGCRCGEQSKIICICVVSMIRNLQKKDIV